MHVVCVYAYTGKRSFKHGRKVPKLTHLKKSLLMMREHCLILLRFVPFWVDPINLRN